LDHVTQIGKDIFLCILFNKHVLDLNFASIFYENGKIVVPCCTLDARMQELVMKIGGSTGGHQLEEKNRVENKIFFPQIFRKYDCSNREIPGKNCGRFKLSATILYGYILKDFAQEETYQKFFGYCDEKVLHGNHKCDCET